MAEARMLSCYIYPLLLFRYLFLCLVLAVIRDLAGSLGWSHSLDSVGL